MSMGGREGGGQTDILSLKKCNGILSTTSYPLDSSHLEHWGEKREKQGKKKKKRKTTTTTNWGTGTFLWCCLFGFGQGSSNYFKFIFSNFEFVVPWSKLNILSSPFLWYCLLCTIWPRPESVDEILSATNTLLWGVCKFVH